MRTNTRKFRLALSALVLLILSLLLTPAMTWAQIFYWAKSYGGAGSDGATSIQQTTDGGYVVAGFTDSFGAGEEDFWVLKLHGDGTIQWQKTYGGAGSDGAFSIQQTTDGGYVVAGYTGSFGAEEADFWVLKLAGDGNIPECDLIGTSTATVTGTTVTGVDSNVTPSASNAAIIDTTIDPADSDASVSTQCYYYAPPTPTPIPVGGVIMPVSKVELLAPWLGLAALMAATIAAVVVRRRA